MATPEGGEDKLQKLVGGKEAGRDARDVAVAAEDLRIDPGPQRQRLVGKEPAEDPLAGPELDGAMARKSPAMRPRASASGTGRPSSTWMKLPSR